MSAVSEKGALFKALLFPLENKNIYFKERKIIMATTEKTANTKKIRLYKDNDKYKRDVQVIINGKAYLIQRGVEVEVPCAVAEVLEHAQDQSQRAIELSDAIGKNRK